MQSHSKQFLKSALLMAAAVATVPHAALADNDAANPLYLNGAYVSVLGTATEFLGDGNRPDLGGGVDLIGGVRRGVLGLEAGLSSTFATDTTLLGGYASLMVFPFAKLPGLYGIGGIGFLNVGEYPNNDQDFHTTTTHIGPGYLFPLELFGYSMGLRVEGLYRYGRQNSLVTQQRPSVDPSDEPDPNAPSTFNDVLLRVGLHVPLPLRSPEPPPPPPQVEVVQPLPPPDSDGDGVQDERDQCPDTPPNSEVDAQGCPLPPPPCEAPAPGERVSLSGCATGDSIALRGVNFEFDEARLTLNAKTILDDVADELTTYSSIAVEFSGHTDSRGSDDYNQSLSKARARSVVEYLESKGIDSSRMTSAGFGESQPVADNDTDEGRELNRRVELKVTASASGAARAPTPPSATPGEGDELLDMPEDTTTAPPPADDDAPDAPPENLETDEALDDLFSDF